MESQPCLEFRLPSGTGSVPPATLSSYSPLVQLRRFQYPIRLVARRESVFRSRPARHYSVRPPKFWGIEHNVEGTSLY